MSTAITPGSRPSAAWIAVAFVLSRYAGAAVAKYSASGLTPARARSAARDASTAMDVVSSS